MAIAYYVPPEYGPVQPQQQAQAPNDPPVVDIHEFHQDANNNNVGRREVPPMTRNNTNQLVALFTGFVTEMLDAFRNRESEQPEPQQQQRAPQSIRERRPVAQQLPNLRIHEQQQDNQAPLNLPDLIPTPFRCLPDIVSCHAGMSIRYNSTSTSNQPTSQSPSQSRDRPPVVPLSPRSSNHHLSPSTMDFEVSLKLEMSVGQNPESDQIPEDPERVPASPQELYRIEGARLRAIADSFERSRSSSRPSQSTFELKIVISVAVPTVALVAFGIAYWRHS